MMVNVLIAAIGFFSFSATKLTVDMVHSNFSFVLDHPFHQTIGKAQSFNCHAGINDNGNIASISFSARIDQFNTGNTARDSHVREITEALLYPSVTFTSSNITKQDSTLSLEGALLFHGVSKNILFKVTERVLSETSKLYIGKTVVKLSDFGMSKPVLFFIPSSDDLHISFEIRLTRQ